MSSSTILHIQDTIQTAIQSETTAHSLYQFAEVALPKLHRGFLLPEVDTVDAFVRFLKRYIEHVPESFTAISKLANEAEIADLLDPVLSIAKQVFLASPDGVEAHTRLYGLLSDAYLAHRLLEEVNDRLMSVLNAPLAPMNMATANVLVHSLLGDKFANELDMTVLFAIDGLFNKMTVDEPSILEALKGRKAELGLCEYSDWPCLAQTELFQLKLGDEHTDEFVH